MKSRQRRREIEQFLKGFGAAAPAIRVTVAAGNAADAIALINSAREVLATFEIDCLDEDLLTKLVGMIRGPDHGSGHILTAVGPAASPAEAFGWPCQSR